MHRPARHSFRPVIRLAALLLTCMLHAAEPPAISWGKEVNQQTAGIRGSSEFRMLTHARLDTVLASPRKTLPAEAFQYAMIAQDRQVWFTARLPYAPTQVEGQWHAETDWADVDTYRYRQGMSTKNGYPELPTAATSAGKVVNRLNAEKLVVVWIVYLPTGENEGDLLRTAPTTLNIQPPRKQDLSDKTWQALVEKLVAGFRSDAYQAKNAHALASRIGQDVVPPLIALADEPTLSAPGRMWLATALIDLGGAASIAAVTRILKQGQAVSVIAFHGPKLRDADLNTAIVEAVSGGEPESIAWALRGFSSFGDRRVPTELLDLAIAHEKPELRATALEVMVLCPDKGNHARVAKLLNDDHPRVRSGAAVAAARLGMSDDHAITAMVAALPEADGQMRVHICRALSKISGQARKYDPDGAAEAQEAVIRYWQQWFTKRQK